MQTIVTCPNCGAKNRVEDRPGVRPVCGRCHTPLAVGSDGAAGGAAADGRVVEVTDATFDQVIRSAGDKPVLVDCWAAWCGPCKMIAPTIEQLAKESGGRWVIAKLNVDENPQVSQKYQISSIPTMLIFRNGALVNQVVGLRGKAELVQALEGVGAGAAR
jgi:thioredoxin